MSPIKKRPRGRPVSKDPASAELPKIRITPRKLTAYKRNAKKAKLTFSEWVRMALDKACK